MQHKCRVEVIDKKLFPEYQDKYLADPRSGVCPFYQVGDVTVFERYAGEDTFWTEAKGAHCAEAWDCISRYIYTALQGGAIMRGWTNDERLMIACCNDGTRPVVFKIERQDYKALYFDRALTDADRQKLRDSFMRLDGVTDVNFREDRGFIEVFVEKDIPDELIKQAARSAGDYLVTRID